MHKAYRHGLLIIGGIAAATAFAQLPARAQSGRDASLSDAAAYCRAAEVAQLLAEGANVNTVNSGGYTPLMRAAGEGCAEVVTLLLEAGADASLAHPSFGTAADQAKMHQKSAVEAMLRAAAAGGAAAGAPAAAWDRPGPEVADVASPSPAIAQAADRPTESEAPAPAPMGPSDWPQLGAYRPGEQVLYSGTAGKTWQPGVVRSVDPTYGYNLVDGPSGSYSRYFVIAPQRAPFWTDFFIGDWRVSVPMAMGAVTDGRAVYRTVSGGMRLPPLRISADGTYSWRVQADRGERLLRGRWIANPDGPGVILQNAEKGADWLVYNNTDALGTLGETVIISSDCCSHYDGTRLK